jgi:hypothetical protein
LLRCSSTRRDEAAGDALDLLQRKEIADGWPAGGKYYGSVGERRLHAEHENWGPTGKRRANPWVTADALVVLAGAGRLSHGQPSRPEPGRPTD